MRFYLFMTYLVIMAALVAGMLSGCASAGVMELTTQEDARGRSRSLVFDSRKVQMLQDGLEASGEVGLPWYAGRNDLKPAVVAGYENPSYQYTQTYTVDREYSHNGHVHHHYSKTTRRWESTEVVR